MGTSENALAAFNDEEICPSEFIVCDIGTECKAYFYEPDFLLYFPKSKYLVYINTNNDSLRKAVEMYASRINSSIPAEEE